MSLSSEDSTLPCPASLHLLLPLHQQACPPLDDFKPLSLTPHVAPTAPRLASPLPAGISPSATWMPSLRLLSPLLMTRVLSGPALSAHTGSLGIVTAASPPQPGHSPPCPLPAPGLHDPAPGGVTSGSTGCSSLPWQAPLPPCSERTGFSLSPSC